jgi:hypothetical protein
MDKASELVVKSGNVHKHIREIAPNITEEEHKMIDDLLSCIAVFPIVKNNEDTKGKETSTD